MSLNADPRERMHLKTLLQAQQEELLVKLEKSAHKLCGQEMIFELATVGLLGNTVYSTCIVQYTYLYCIPVLQRKK